MKLFRAVSFFVLIVLVTPIFSKSIGIANFIKSKYLGVTVSYDEVTLRRKSKKVVKKEAVVVAVLLNKDSFMVELDNGKKAMIEFQVNQPQSLSGNSQFGRNKRDLQLQKLKTQEIINSSLRSIGSSGSGVQSGSSMLSRFNQFGGSDELGNESVFTSTEEIIYTDLRFNKKQKGLASATLNGMFLDTGAPISLFFVVKRN